jgi:quercetin dioxygenase-like cupin family protein
LIAAIMKERPEGGYRFVGAGESLVEVAERGSIDWISHAKVTDAQQIMIARAVMEPGQMHSFHCHPRREEVIYVLEGRFEQWVGEESRILGPGDMAHIPAGMVHATFTLDAPVKFLAILSPCQFAGEEVELTIDVDDQEPWKSHLAKRGS